jgi:hypothetical protein
MAIRRLSQSKRPSYRSRDDRTHEDHVNRLLIGLVASAVLSFPVHAEGESPSQDGLGTRTPEQAFHETLTPRQEYRNTGTPVQIALGPETGPGTATAAKPEGEPKVVVLTHEQICGAVYSQYSQALLNDPELENTKNGTYNGFSGLASTIARHTTLQRLITIAMAQNCDPVMFISLEGRMINRTYTSPRVR